VLTIVAGLSAAGATRIWRQLSSAWRWPSSLPRSALQIGTVSAVSFATQVVCHAVVFVLLGGAPVGRARHSPGELNGVSESGWDLLSVNDGLACNSR